MPELPEVETVARSLAPHLEGRRITSIKLFDEKLHDFPTQKIRGATIDRVYRVGKQVCLKVRTPKDRERFILVHLRMTGRLLILPARDEKTTKHLRASFRLSGSPKEIMGFVDTRRFGTLDSVDRAHDLKTKGVDPMSEMFNVSCLTELLRRSGGNQAIKVWLLRQDRLIGLGNIYVSEILWHSKIAPTRAVSRLKHEEIVTLHTQTIRVLKAAIKACGTTFSDFQDGEGTDGSYGEYLSVYGREGKECPECGHTIRRIILAQRSSFYCPKCQR